jgi:hypothetical protein
MKFLLSLLTLFAFSFSSASEWFYYKHYPWVYDHLTEDWLYLKGAEDGNIYTYRQSTKEWEKFNIPEPTWDEKYMEWLQNPEPYGGVNVLQLIKKAKDDSAASIDVGDLLIKNIEPFEGLSQLTALGLGDSDITDISPLRNLQNLKLLILKDNRNLEDLGPLSNLTNLEELDFRYNDLKELDISPILTLSNLQKIRVSSWKISDSQINQIQANLPDCLIALDEDGHDIVWDLEPYWDDE